MSAGGGASDMLSEALLLCEDSPDPPPASTSYIGFATKSENASPVQIPAEKDGPEAADASA
jgi:hypothetical protein